MTKLFFIDLNMPACYCDASIQQGASNEYRQKIGLAVPCGLISNELFTNCLKYAFPGDRRGEINIALRLIKKDNLEISVGDNGIGFLKDFNLYKTESMGLALVVSTIESQLGGKVKLTREGGTQFKVTFKI